MPIATFTLDHAAHVTSWSDAAAAWFGHPPAEVLGQHCRALLAEDGQDAVAVALGRATAGQKHSAVVSATLGDSSVHAVLLSCFPLAEATGTTGLLCQVSDIEDAPPSELQMAFVDAIMRTSPFGLGMLDTDLRYVLVNDTLAEFNGIPAREHIGHRVREVVRAADNGEYEKHLRKVLETGDPLDNVLITSRSRGRRDRDRVWSVTFFRLTGRQDQVLGLGGLIVDVTQKETALLEAAAVRQRLALVNQASSRVGTTLETRETARELTQFVVPEFADAASVELRTDFLDGPRFPAADQPVATMRLACHSVLEDSADRLLCTGDGDEQVHQVGSWSHESLCTGRPWHSEKLDGRDASGPALPAEPDDTAGPVDAREPDDAADLVDAREPDDVGEPDLHPAEPAAEEPARPPADGGIDSLIIAPLIARGRCLGLVKFGRSAEREPLDEDDLRVAEELADRTALSLDNARLYDEERRIAVALQRTMLPGEKDITGRPGLDVAYHYRSTSRSAKVGGDWFDAITLSGHRVALVVGDMMGHDIHAAAAMGQLRTAMHTLARLDLEPVDLLTRLDDTVQNNPAMQHATCVYAVYNTVTRRCSIANAGHPAPVLRYADRSVELVSVEPGMPLGIGIGAPEFAVAELVLPEDSTLVLYTDGLIERRDRDIDVGIDHLCAALARQETAGLAVQQLCDRVVGELTDRPGDDDLAVLMARTPAMPEHRSTHWTLAPRPDSVREARSLVRATLHTWELDGLVNVAELLMSELVTNAVRYSRGDVGVQMALGETLVVEVTDDDERLPHRTAVSAEDERGRGLTLVHEIAQQWGSRSTSRGKVVWFELPLHGVDDDSGTATPEAGDGPGAPAGQDSAGAAERGVGVSPAVAPALDHSEFGQDGTEFPTAP